MKTEKELKPLHGTDGSSDLFLNLNIELSETCNEFLQKLPDKSIATFPDKEIIKNKLKSGIPFVAYSPLSFQSKAVENLAQKIIATFKSYNVVSSEFLIWYNDCDKSKILEKIIRSCVSSDFEPLEAIASGTQIEPETLFLVGKEILKPFFRIIAKNLLNMASFDDWTKGYCPICGGLPGFARFSKEKEGQRYLWCSRCDVEWNYMRICCPFCGNNEQKTLKFLTTDHREEHRIDVCDKCKGYVKTFDERKVKDFAGICFVKEEMDSIYLDMVAEKQGYLIKLPGTRDVNCSFS